MKYRSDETEARHATAPDDDAKMDCGGGAGRADARNCDGMAPMGGAAATAGIPARLRHRGREELQAAPPGAGHRRSRFARGDRRGHPRRLPPLAETPTNSADPVKH